MSPFVFDACIVSTVWFIQVVSRFVPPENPDDATARFFAAVEDADADMRNDVSAVKRRFQKRLRDGASTQSRDSDISQQAKRPKGGKRPYDRQPAVVE